MEPRKTHSANPAHSARLQRLADDLEIQTGGPRLFPLGDLFLFGILFATSA